MSVLLKRASTPSKPNLAKGKLDTSGAWPLQRRDLMQRSEAVLFHRFSEALPDHVILAQVAMQSFLKVRQGERQAQAWQWKFDKKYVDFVICDQNFAIIAVVELDGASHRDEKQAERDRDKSRALSAAGIRLVRLEPERLPSGQAIRELLGITVTNLS
ncbi:DUF2726 domain-containing protein [Solimonas terrae]|uniref:DUF2726 domain-containing protein n=1 Tax=Solimonas terrae TaxID=1396819 RepID=A0A6M2BV33_9GAMM|nr:DUF2726 domain-containing protein [Solimonas terrae]NGY05807.1 DUF2726 domain-containing protein [Solimonas terrae]